MLGDAGGVELLPQPVGEVYVENRTISDRNGEESGQCPSCKSKKLRRTHRIGSSSRGLCRRFLDCVRIDAKSATSGFFASRRIAIRPSAHLASPSETRHALRG